MVDDIWFRKSIGPEITSLQSSHVSLCNRLVTAKLPLKHWQVLDWPGFSLVQAAGEHEHEQNVQVQNVQFWVRTLFNVKKRLNLAKQLMIFLYPTWL